MIANTPSPVLSHVLQRVPYAWRFGRMVVRACRRWNGPALLRMAAQRPPIRLVLGASGICDPGWTPTEIEFLDITREDHWQRFFPPSSVTAMLAEHVWEHLTPDDAVHAAALSYQYLCPGGHLRVAVPDGFHPDPDYIRHVMPGGDGPGAADHKVLYTLRTLGSLFQSVEFGVRPLEYFDEHGRFHFAGWDPSDGMVHRSSRFDHRNADGQLHYTSLILDACKT